MGAIATDTRRKMLDDQVKSAGDAEWKIYCQILAKGETAEWAAMCALRQAPGSRGTERAFSEGASRQMGRMSDITRRSLLAAARRAGIATDGKCYKGGLGRPDDPAAWVSTSDDVLAVAKARNLTVDGAVRHKGVEHCGPPKRVRLATDIVDQLERDYRAEDPGLDQKVRKSPKARRELRERIVDKHGSKRKD